MHFLDINEETQIEVTLVAYIWPLTNYIYLTTLSGLHRSQTDFFIDIQVWSRAALFNTVATSHMWLLVIYFGAILKVEKAKFSLFIRILRSFVFKFEGKYVAHQSLVTLIGKHDVNFTSILHAAFLYKSVLLSFFVLTLWVSAFWHKEIGVKDARKMLVKWTKGGIL